MATMTRTEVVARVGDELFARWHRERHHLDRIDRWARWEHDDTHRPKDATTEYRELTRRAQAPWGDLIVSSVAQTLYVEGWRRPSDPTDGSGWDLWQANGMDARQVSLHRSALTYGTAYGLVLPGRTLAGESTPLMRGVSAREMLALYDDAAFDEWPQLAMRIVQSDGGWSISVFDDTKVHRLRLSALHDKPFYVGEDIHDVGVPPVVRYTNRMDLEGRTAGEVEPFIPLLGKIDQTSADRLIVQRFASWVVRTIAGMAVAETAKATDKTPEQVVRELKVNDFLTSEDPNTRFGSLPATPLDGFIKAHESDIQVLAAVSQTPAYEMLGQLANLSADALAAARASLTAKSDERKHTLGEAHEQLIRLALHVAGNRDAAEDFTAQVRWADTTIRSLAQAVDAYGKLVQMLGFPAEVLWPKVPGMTQQDVDEALVKASQGGSMEELLRELSSGQTSFEDV